MVALGAVAVLGLWLGLGLGGCGDDGGGTPPPSPATPRPGTQAPTGPKPPQLAEKMHIEDRVSCPIPAQPSDPRDGKCDPNGPSCPEHLYCLKLGQGGSYCEPCPERDGIRHSFKERDFAVEQNRDPFQSFLLPSLSIGKERSVVQIDPTKKCPREDQMVATSYSYAELKLVGIVAQGTLRKALMMGGPLGYIIKRGDCVGKEKAYVKDIGTGYITFLLDPDATSASLRTPEEYSVQLNPKQLAVADPELPTPAPRTVITPVVTPPAVLSPRSAIGPGAGSAASGVGARGAVAPGAVAPGAVAPGAAAPLPPIESPPGTAKKKP